MSCRPSNSPIKKVYYINSYHQGYGSSDDVMLGINEVLNGKVDCRIFFMDTKRNGEPSAISLKVKAALSEIESYKPDIIIVSDDNAVKYIIEPHFKNHKIPVVFCGVNWSADQYGLPANSVTGMLEVLPFKETVGMVRNVLPDIRTLTVLSENTTSEKKNREAMQPQFKELGMEVDFVLVDDFEGWKAGFQNAQKQSDLIYVPTNGAIKNWDDEGARSFVQEHISKPVITCDDFMMPYAVFGLTKVAREQGEWAAATALKILEGTEPREIPVSKNSQYEIWLNGPLAIKIGFRLDDETMKTSKIIK